jgi:hypothetical protein
VLFKVKLAVILVDKVTFPVDFCWAKAVILTAKRAKSVIFFIVVYFKRLIIDSFPEKAAYSKAVFPLLSLMLFEVFR